jgi:hypothetical protein
MGRPLALSSLGRYNDDTGGAATGSEGWGVLGTNFRVVGTLRRVGWELAHVVILSAASAHVGCGGAQRPIAQSAGNVRERAQTAGYVPSLVELKENQVSAIVDVDTGGRLRLREINKYKLRLRPLHFSFAIRSPPSSFGVSNDNIAALTSPPTEQLLKPSITSIMDHDHSHMSHNLGMDMLHDQPMCKMNVRIPPVFLSTFH